MKKSVVLQVNDAAVRIRLGIFGLRYSSFIQTLHNRLEGGGEEKGATPLACCVGLTVIWSGAPTGSLWEVSYSMMISSGFDPSPRERA